MGYTTKDIEFLSETYGRQIDFRTHLDLVADHGRGAKVEKSYSNGVVTQRHHLVDGRVVTRHEGMFGTLYFVREA